jgi:hypothetical protein
MASAQLVRNAEEGRARVIARSCARESREPRQVRKEAAVPTNSLCRGEA